MLRNPEDDPDLEEIRRDAAADVAELEKDRKFFGTGAPQEDDGL